MFWELNKMSSVLVVLQATTYQVLAMAIVLSVAWFMLPRAAGAEGVWGFDEKKNFWGNGEHQPH